MNMYNVIYNELKEAIDTGFYNPNDKLPIEKELSETYKCSRGTVKRAIDMLKHDGYVQQIKGSGTYVTDISNRVNKNEIERQFLGFSRSNSGEKVTTKVIDFEIVVADSNIADKLQIEKDDYVYKINRVRYRNDIAYTIEYTYMPLTIVPNLKVKHLENSIYEYLENELKLDIHSSKRILTTRIANEFETELLHDTFPIAVHECEQLSFLTDGTPYEYATVISHGKYSQYKFQIVRD